MKRITVAVLLGFTVTLAVVVGHRMSGEAIAVVVGVVCGVAASIPMSVLILIVLNRSTRQAEVAEPPYGRRSAQYGASPPVVVIQGGTPAPSGLLRPYYPGQTVTSEPAQRSFRIIGQSGD